MMDVYDVSKEVLNSTFSQQLRSYSPSSIYSELLNQTDSTTQGIKRNALAHFTAIIIIDKEWKEIVFFDPMTEDKGTEEQKNERR